MQGLRNHSRKALTIWHDRSDLKWLVSKHASVGYLGWLNRGNLGDESMFLAHQIAMHAGIRRIPIQRLGFKLARNATLDTLVLGGGTLLGRREWGQRLELAIELFNPKKLVTFGVGIEEPDFAFERDLISEKEWEKQVGILKTFSLVGVRGPRSQKILEDFGVKSEVLGDPSLIFDRSSEPQKPTYRRPRVLLSLADVHDGYELGGHRMRKEIARAARQISHSMGAELIGLPMESTDTRALRSADSEISIPDYPRKISNLVKAIANADLVISERLHPNIIAAAVGTRFIAIGYKPKTYDFAESIGAGELVIDSRGLSASEIIEEADRMTHIKSSEIDRNVSCLSQKFKDKVSRELG